MSITVVYDVEQGLPGPPSGPGTEVEYLPYIGAGSGPTKTITGVFDNTIYEAFSTGDELFTTWVVPKSIDRSINPIFKGSYFPTEDNGSHVCSWEVHITAHNADHSYTYTTTLTAADLPLSVTAFDPAYGVVGLDSSTVLINNVDTVHIRLRRIASSNDPNFTIGVSNLRIEYGHDGLVGEQGPQGVQGPAGGEEDVPYAKKVDFITDNEMYIGEADPGTSEASALWRIKYVTIAGDGDVSTTWADGDANFDNVWANRIALSYS